MKNDTHISSSMFIMRALAAPLRVPWSPGKTWTLAGIAAIAVWAGIEVWWLAPVGFGLLAIVGGVMRSEIDDEKWEMDQVQTLQKHLVWMIDNRNALAQLAGVRYMGGFLDDNDVTLWQLSTAPQDVEHDGVYEIRKAAAFGMACAAADDHSSPGSDGSIDEDTDTVSTPAPAYEEQATPYESEGGSQ